MMSSCYTNVMVLVGLLVTLQFVVSTLADDIQTQYLDELNTTASTDSQLQTLSDLLVTEINAANIQLNYTNTSDTQVLNNTTTARADNSTFSQKLRSTTEDIGDKESHGGLAAGLAIAMVVCIAISVGMFLCRKRGNKKKPEETDPSESSLLSASQNSLNKGADGPLK